VGDRVSEPFSKDRKPAAGRHAPLKNYYLPLRQMRPLPRPGRKHQFEWIAEVQKLVGNKFVSRRKLYEQEFSSRIGRGIPGRLSS